MDGLIEQADAAKKFWLENGLDGYDYILLLPHKDERLNAAICGVFAGKLISSADILARAKILVLSAEKLEESTLYKAQNITVQEAESLLYLYGLYEFTDKLIIGSLELPYGRKANNLLDCGVASKEELIEAVIFGDLCK